MGAACILNISPQMHWSVPLCTTLALSVGVGCHKREQIPQAVRVETASLAYDTSSATYSGVAVPYRITSLAFRAPGTVETIGAVALPAGGSRPLQAGDSVKEGTRLVALRATEFKNQVAEASGMRADIAANHSRAAQEFQRAKDLFAQGVISKSAFDAARAQYGSAGGAAAAAGARVSTAKTALKDTALTAPWDGTVLRINAAVGSTFPPGQEAVAIGDLSYVNIAFSVAESVVRSLAVGQTVSVQADQPGALALVGTLIKVSAQADSRVQTYDVEAQVDNRARLIGAGTLLRVRLGGSKAVSLMVPLRAVVAEPSGGFALFVPDAATAGQRVHKRVVTLGTLLGSRIAVQSGLLQGEQYVSQGASLLAEGQEVVVLQ
jgi:RND family efflux transporter MFP subunit